MLYRGGTQKYEKSHTCAICCWWKSHRCNAAKGMHVFMINCANTEANWRSRMNTNSSLDIQGVRITKICIVRNSHTSNAFVQKTKKNERELEIAVRNKYSKKKNRRRKYCPFISELVLLRMNENNAPRRNTDGLSNIFGSNFFFYHAQTFIVMDEQ